MRTDYGRDEAKAFAKEHLRGIFSAVPLAETAQGDIDESSFRRNLRHCVDELGSHGVYLHGFYGNYWLLTSAERKRVLEIAFTELGDDVPIVCRCAHPSLKEAIDLVKHAEANGADFISMIGPAFGATTPDMVFDYFDAIARETRLGISVFNTGHAGYLMTPELLARLATIPNVVALKNAASIAHTLAVRELVGDELLVVDPFEDRFLLNLLHFGQQVIYTYANYLYDRPSARPMRDYVDAAFEGDAAKATVLYYRLEPRRAVQEKWVRGGWRQLGHCPVSVVKRWTQALGMDFGATRAPLPRITPEEQEELLIDLRSVGLLD